jgi:hypothetical protein
MVRCCHPSFTLGEHFSKGKARYQAMLYRARINLINERTLKKDSGGNGAQTIKEALLRLPNGILYNAPSESIAYLKGGNNKKPEEFIVIINLKLPPRHLSRQIFLFTGMSVSFQSKFLIEFSETLDVEIG